MRAFGGCAVSPALTRGGFLLRRGGSNGSPDFCVRRVKFQRAGAGAARNEDDAQRERDRCKA